jgi:7-cyano-7-deazaguanine synthase
MSRSAVLLSGGLDSAVLMALELRDGHPVQPVHVRVGLAWEDAEAAMIARLLGSARFTGSVAPLATLGLEMRDVYPSTHWALSGQGREYDEPDESVYLEGRNVALIAKCAVFCAGRGIHRITLGPLAGNPFPDATPEFFVTMARAMTLGLAHDIAIATPLASMHKPEVIRIGAQLAVPFEHTLSCMGPIGLEHCGRCNKCRERLDAFRDAGIRDPATYAEAGR